MLSASALPQRSPVVGVWPFAITAIAVAMLLGAILAFNDGVFVYTLDDPYIHMALAANIAEFHYGLNASAYAAPSSSILWPFLLAPFAGMDRFVYVPLAFNLAALGANVALLHTLFRRAFADASHADLAATWLTIASVLTLNLVGLALTGMEHELQVTLALAVLLGIHDLARGDGPPRWLVAAIICGPLVRYESLSLTIAAAAVLFVHGYRYPALTAIGAVAALLGGFSLFLLSLGLPALPSSVMTKLAGPVAVSGAAPVGGVAEFLVRRGADIILEPRPAVLFVLAATGLGAWLLLSRRKRDHRGVLAVMTLTGAGHLALGGWDALARYEIYVLAVLVGGLFVVYGDELRAAMERTRPATLLLACSLALAVVFGRYIGVSTKSPLAANNIYEQQYQMHRFVTEYHRAPVAVNDLGLVSFGNPNFVLDLWGLGSEEARRAWRTAQQGWPERLVERHKVPLVMIYSEWFARSGGVSPDWTLVGRLFLGSTVFSVGGNPVDFYVTPAGDPATVRGQLQRFAPSLPEGVHLQIL